ncbi:MAG: hypothetical protein PVG96_06425 [Desulfobacterales bacterium]|jgi:hypothetical protein
MTAVLKIIAGTVLILVLIAFAPVSLQSYVLQGPHIIQLMTEKLGQAESLSVSQRVIFYNIAQQPPAVSETGGDSELEIAENDLDDKQAMSPLDDTEVIQPDSLSRDDSLDEADDSVNLTEDQSTVADQTDSSPELVETIQLDESLKYLFSEAFRSDIVSDSNQRVFVSNQGQAITVIDGVISDTGESQFDAYKDLLLYRSREILSERLTNLGIDISVSSLGKFDGRLALVIGAEFPDQTVPQVWIDKETFQPLGIIVFGAKNPYSTQTGFLEIRYSNWQQIGKISYPMLIEFIQDGMIVRAIEVDDYQINPDFSKDVFDIARLRSEYRQSFPTSDPSHESEGLSEVQKTIEEFKKIFE